MWQTGGNRSAPYTTTPSIHLHTPLHRLPSGKLQRNTWAETNMECSKENGINGVERNDKKIDPLTKKDVQTILQMMPQGLDADEFIMRLCNEAVYYARWLGKA